VLSTSGGCASAGYRRSGRSVMAPRSRLELAFKDGERFALAAGSELASSVRGARNNS
jgi:hypothetical protein